MWIPQLCAGNLVCYIAPPLSVQVRISQASAEQRRGRAGRTAPGTCYRLWDERDDAALPAVSEPEICTADLAPLALDLALWGSPDGGGLPWLDPPPQDQLEAGLELLKVGGRGLHLRVTIRTNVRFCVCLSGVL